MYLDTGSQQHSLLDLGLTLLS